MKRASFHMLLDSQATADNCYLCHGSKSTEKCPIVVTVYGAALSSTDILEIHPIHAQCIADMVLAQITSDEEREAHSEQQQARFQTQQS